MRDINCTEDFCVIPLSAEACREEGSVLSSDHIVYKSRDRGEEGERWIDRGMLGKKGGDEHEMNE